MSKDQHDTIKIEHGSHLEATDGSINGSTIRPSGDREKRFSPDGSGDLHGVDGAPVVAMNIIENPLQRLNKEETVEAARQFCKDKGLEEHEELFARASLVSRDPLLFEDLSELLPEERAALIYEREHKWAGSKQLWYAILICALGAATQGWDQTGSNGANLSFPQEFGIGRTYGEAGGLRDEWIVGAVNSIIYLTAGLIGCWISDPLNHWFGRRGEIAITAVFLIATPIGSGFTQSWQQLFAVRFVMGIAIGAKNATVPIFSAEMAPARIRGGLVMFWQLWVCFGIFLGFAANVIVKDTGRIAWRLQLGSAFIPALPLLLGIYFCPESPRWLMKKGKYPKAFRSMKRLRKHEIIAARDLYYSHVLYEEEARVAKGATYFTRLWDCFRIPRIRRANYGATTVMLAQQFCGINIISFYSSTVFVEGGYTPTQALYASLGFGAVQLVFCAPAVFLVDTFGRRPLLLSTFPFMVLTLLATGLAFLMDEANAQARVALIATFIYLFSAFYSIGEGPCAFMYSAEVFPTIQREQGMAWAVAVNNTFAGILGLTFPPMRRAMTPTGAFGFYAGLNLVSLIMIFCLVPETKRLTLEELDQVFSVPTAQFIRHEWNEWLPWVFKRYVFRRKDLVKPPPIMETGDNLRRAASRHG